MVSFDGCCGMVDDVVFVIMILVVADKKDDDEEDEIQRVKKVKSW